MTWWSLTWTTSPLWLAVNALAAYRLTRLWVADMLPPLPRIRETVTTWAEQLWDYKGRDGRDRSGGTGADPEFERWRIYGGTPPLAYLVTCAWCSGYWISLAVFLLATLFPTAVWAFVAVPLAFSAVAGLLHHATE